MVKLVKERCTWLLDICEAELTMCSRQDTMQKWFSEQDQRYVLNALTADAVRAHKNVRKASAAQSC